MEGRPQYNPRTIEEVLRDFRGRRAGIIKALTHEAEEFLHFCDPEKENLSLYGFPNEKWEVNLPAEEVPPELPEPALGINFARDGMETKEWLALIAAHSDAWLLAVAFYFGARFGFDKHERRRLFSRINELPTVHEVVTESGNEQSKEKSLVSNHSSSKSKSSSKVVSAKIYCSSIQKPRDAVVGTDDFSRAKYNKSEDEDEPEEEEQEEEVEQDEEEDEHGEALCGACGKNDPYDEFWICCDVCERWFHGKCVKITPAKAEHIKQYKCPSCSSHKRVR
ncbi:PHD finger protein ALFIN-LIKE 3-like protein [Drosera capensis]